eukprot:6589063-Prymnesium_polylepis.1
MSLFYRSEPPRLAASRTPHGRTWARPGGDRGQSFAWSPLPVDHPGESGRIKLRHRHQIQDARERRDR